MKLYLKFNTSPSSLPTHSIHTHYSLRAFPFWSGRGALFLLHGLYIIIIYIKTSLLWIERTKKTKSGGYSFLMMTKIMFQKQTEKILHLNKWRMPQESFCVSLRSFPFATNNKKAKQRVLVVKALNKKIPPENWYFMSSYILNFIRYSLSASHLFFHFSHRIKRSK